MPRLIEEIRKNSHLFDEKAPMLLNDKKGKGQGAEASEHGTGQQFGAETHETN
jgi:hypothetical protein